MNTVCGRVCSLRFTFERQEGLPAVSDLRQGFLSLTIVQPHVKRQEVAFTPPCDVLVRFLNSNQ